MVGILIKILKKLKIFIPTPKRISYYLRDQVNISKNNRLMFGILFCVNFIFPYFISNYKCTADYYLLSKLRIFGFIIMLLLTIKNRWNIYFKKNIYPFFWHFTICYCLPFFATLMFLITDGSIYSVLNVGTTVFCLTLILTTELFVIHFFLGIGLGLFFYSFCINRFDLMMITFNTKYFLIYQLIFPTMIGLIFSYTKKILHLIFNNKEIKLGRALCTELKVKNNLKYVEILTRRLQFINSYFEMKNVNGNKGCFISKTHFEDIVLILNKLEGDVNKIDRNINNCESVLFNIENRNIKILSMKELVINIIKNLKLNESQNDNLEIINKEDFYVRYPIEKIQNSMHSLFTNILKNEDINKTQIKIDSSKVNIRQIKKGKNFILIKSRKIKYSLLENRVILT
ncbi:MAG: hypothetical protein GY830_01345 [Bacteroidetes bacterium]|nr:hypothetical protein [Bacteroidota bacterium]